MFDFHTHILPGLDDGSGSVDESLAMLNELGRQGVDGIAATPHFYADQVSPDTFFERRQAAWETLAPRLTSTAPQIRLGAEVYYFEGIDRYHELERFCIQGTRLLLLEMPGIIWTNRMIRSLTDIQERDRVTVLMAHVERYLHTQKKETWEYLLQAGIRMQANADFFIRHRTRGKAMKLLRDGKIHLLGTDCHNMTTRKPNMESAFKVFAQKKSQDLLDRMNSRASMLLNEMTPSETGASSGLKVAECENILE